MRAFLYPVTCHMVNNGTNIVLVVSTLQGAFDSFMSVYITCNERVFIDLYSLIFKNPKLFFNMMPVGIV